MHDAFFARDTLIVAEQLLGCYLVRRMDGHEIIVQITETEAYKGSEDPASHAYRGKTPRNEPMFGPPGHLYVYLSYGMHYCMNIVTEEQGIPGAVLIRGCRPIKGVEQIRLLRPNVSDAHLLNGPGKLTQGLGIDLSFNRFPLSKKTDPRLFFVPREKPYPFLRTRRIGISKGKELLWRFVIRSEDQ